MAIPKILDENKNKTGFKKLKTYGNKKSYVGKK